MTEGKGKCPHREFPLREGCPLCIADREEREGNTEASIAEAVKAVNSPGPEKVKVNIKVTAPEEPTEEEVAEIVEEVTNLVNVLEEIDQEPVATDRLSIEQRALVRIAPETDEKATALYNEGVKLLEYAKAREITCNGDMKPATEDLAVITKTKQAIELIRQEYVKPIRHHLDAINTAFKEFTAPLIDADAINRKKLIIYRAEVERQIAEAQAIEQEKLDLARREEKLTGEHTVDLAPVDTPEVASKRVHTDMGSMGTLKTYKWELEDITKVPREYLIPNAVLIGQMVRSSKGTISIPGIRVYSEDSIRVNTR